MQQVLSSQNISPIDSVPCHLDLHPENMIYSNGNWYLIDFERVSLFDPYYDVAIILMCFC
ncbi:MAG: phosphotransferase [Holosporaceae bacterium]|nr:phosphotransferase [Holosporaceae bacterium]